MHAQIAKNFQHDNAFLVGDAAHRIPPAGGFGLNTGLQDAHNLAWKLSLAINGNAHENLLQTYHTGYKNNSI